MGRHPGRDAAFLRKTQICSMVSVCAFIIVITELKEKRETALPPLG